jgi:hypothetical protein
MVTATAPLAPTNFHHRDTHSFTNATRSAPVTFIPLPHGIPLAICDDLATPQLCDCTGN